MAVNRIYENGTCPELWNSGKIVLIFKKGDKIGTNNYREIKIINMLKKLFTKILAKRLQIV